MGQAHVSALRAAAAVRLQHLRWYHPLHMSQHTICCPSSYSCTAHAHSLYDNLLPHAQGILPIVVAVGRLIVEISSYKAESKTEANEQKRHRHFWDVGIDIKCSVLQGEVFQTQRITSLETRDSRWRCVVL